MNIYITKDNESFLKEIAIERSMSGLVNELLDKYRGRNGAVAETKTVQGEEESPEEVEQTFEEMGYVYDRAGDAIYDKDGERVPGKVSVSGKILKLL